MKYYTFSIILLLIFIGCRTQSPKSNSMPIIDMHLHTHSLWVAGKPGPAADTTWFPNGLIRPKTDEDLMLTSLSQLKRYNIVKAMGNGFSLNEVERWKAKAPDVIIPGIQSLLATSQPEKLLKRLRDYFESGRAKVFGEILPQFAGLSPADTSLDKYFSLAEELDIPVALHMGDGFPGCAYTSSPKYRMSLNNPIILEDLLVRHPKMRIYIMHAGWPFEDEMIALLYAYPQIYVDIGVINWYIPRKEFHTYLKRMIDAGFGKRIMFGTDHMQWPEAIGIAVEAINTTDFLTNEQRRDIFYNNAARFLRFTDEEIARHHGK